MHQTKAKVIKNIVVAPECYKMVLACAPIAKSARPGEFVTVKISGSDQPLLRRPFSIHRIGHQLPLRLRSGQAVTSHQSKTYDTLEIIYEVVGKGTEILSRKKAGECLDIIGPLGNGFDYHQPSTINYRPILVAGGMGVAPLLFLSERLVTSHPFDCAQGRQPPATSTPLVLLGARRKKQIFCEKEFKKFGCEVKIATDDGSRGFKGRVTELLKDLLLKNLRTKELKNIIYGCGPKPMLKEISRISAKYNIPAQVSLEEHMVCGIGACLGCVVKIRRQKAEGRRQKKQNNVDFEYVRVCKEGPVFQAQDIIWEVKP